MGKQVE